MFTFPLVKVNSGAVAQAHLIDPQLIVRVVPSPVKNKVIAFNLEACTLENENDETEELKETLNALPKARLIPNTPDEIVAVTIVSE